MRQRSRHHRIVWRWHLANRKDIKSVRLPSPFLPFARRNIAARLGGTGTFLLAFIIPRSMWVLSLPSYNSAASVNIALPRGSGFHARITTAHGLHAWRQATLRWLYRARAYQRGSAFSRICLYGARCALAYSRWFF